MSSFRLQLHYPHYLIHWSKGSIKAEFPTQELQREAQALLFFKGQGSARLFEFDTACGTLLLERVEPSISLGTLCKADDVEATLVAARLMRRLWRRDPGNHSFLSVANWFGCFNRPRASVGGGTGPLPARLIKESESQYAELLRSATDEVILHGDLHHGNILSAEREPRLAVDPKGVIGEPAFEVGALLRNPLPQLLEMSQPVAILSRRVDLLAGKASPSRRLKNRRGKPNASR